MNFGNDQKIESVNQSTIVQAKGDILAEFLFYKTIVDWDKVAFPASTSF